MSKRTSVGKYGLRYLEHETRTTGEGKMKRPLRYYSARYSLNGKRKEDVFGWEDTFPGGIPGIEAQAAQLYKNRKAKTPPFSYKEILQSREQALQNAINLTFDNMFKDYCRANEHKDSLRDDIDYHEKWLSPSIGHKRLNEIFPLDLERIKAKMKKAGKDPQTTAHINEIVRQVYHYAIDLDLYADAAPTLKLLEKQESNNKQNRLLTPEEADKLLTEIRKHSEKAYHQALLSMNTGMRFSEIANLRWQNVCLDQKYMVIVDTQNHDLRAIRMNDALYDIFSSMKPGQPRELVFPSTTGTKMTQIPDTFSRAVEKLGFNDGITDDQLKVVFQTLRDSCINWLQNAYIKTQKMAEIFGPKSIAMKLRYEHPDDLIDKDASNILEEIQAIRTKIFPSQRSED